MSSFNLITRGEVMEKVTTVGIDLAKAVFSLHGVDGAGRMVLKRTVRRDQLVGAAVRAPWAYGEADGAEVRGAVPKERQERRQRCGGHLRGGDAPEHAVR